MPKITASQLARAKGIVRRHGPTDAAVAVARTYRSDAPAVRGVRRPVLYWSRVHEAVVAIVQKAATATEN